MANLVPSLSPGVFNQGAVRVNSDALTNYIINTQSRNNARDDAFNKYLAQEGNNINEKGVRSQDLPAILDAKNAWQQHSIQHRRELMNPSVDGGRAYAENQKLYNNVKSLVPQSIAAAQNNKEFESIQKDPKKAYLLTDSSVPAYHKSTLPVNHPDYQPMDFTDIYNPKPFNGARLSKDINSIHADYTPGTPIPAGGGMQTITSTKSFSPQALEGIAVKAHSEYNNDASFKNYIDENVANHDSTLYHQLNDIYKQHYGKDIMTPEEGATAYMLSLHGEPATKSVSIKAPVAPMSMDDKKELIKYRSDLTEGRQSRARAAKVTKPGDTSTPVNDEYNSIVNQALSGKPAPYTHVNGVKENEYILPVSPKVLQQYGILNPETGKMSYPTQLNVAADKSYVRPVYSRSPTSPTGKMSTYSDISDKKYSPESAVDAIGKAKYTSKQLMKEKEIIKKRESTAPVSDDEAKQLIIKYLQKK